MMRDPLAILKDNDAELFNRIEEVVHFIWDPLHVAGIPHARGEYNGYISEIFTRVKAGDVQSVLAYMRWVVVSQMGTTFDHARTLTACDVMMDWRESLELEPKELSLVEHPVRRQAL